MSKAFARSGPTVTLSGTTSSSGAAISAQSQTVRVVNAGAVVVFVTFGQAAPTATSADIAVGAGATADLHKAGCGFVAVITATGTATVYVTPGELG